MLYLAFRCLRLVRRFDSSDEVDEVLSSEDSELDEQLLGLEDERCFLHFFLAFDLKNRLCLMHRKCVAVILARVTTFFPAIVVYA